MTCFSTLFQKVAISMVLVGLMMGTGMPWADAKKKAAGPDPAAQADVEVKKGVDPINEQLGKLMIKIQSRALLSPKDAGDLADIKYKLADMMDQYPQNALLAKPVYQAGVLLFAREEYSDAYELFSYVAQGYPTNPYGLKAKGQIQQLEKRFGADYFSAEAAAPAGTASATAPAVPPKK